MTIVDLLRHGQTERPDMLAGRTDLSLSDAGWGEFERQTARGSWEAVVSSPLKRAREAAERLSGARSLVLDIDPDWQEIDLGDWDGQVLSQLQGDPATAQRLAEVMRDPTLLAAPNGETFEQVKARVSSALGRLVERPGPVLVVAHAGTIRTAISLACNVPMAALWSLRIGYGTLVRLNIGRHETHGLWGEIVEVRQP
jgi:alpha-ribazole phosphatase